MCHCQLCLCIFTAILSLVVTSRAREMRCPVIGIFLKSRLSFSLTCWLPGGMLQSSGKNTSIATRGSCQLATWGWKPLRSLYRTLSRRQAPWPAPESLLRLAPGMSVFFNYQCQWLGLSVISTVCCVSEWGISSRVELLTKTLNHFCVCAFQSSTCLL